MKTWSRAFLRDPVLTVANTVLALGVTWVLTALVGGGLVAWADPVEGYWHGVYCAVGHMTTHGCDVEPTKGFGRLISGSLQVWGVVITAAVVAHTISSLIKNSNEFDHNEQEQLKAEVHQCREMLRTLTFRVTGETFK